RSLLEQVDERSWFCNNCSCDWSGTGALTQGRAPVPVRRFASVDDLVARTGLRRDELVTLADIGALNSFGYDRRSALWQAERAVRPAGELFESACGLASEASGPARGGGAPRGLENDSACGLASKASGPAPGGGAPGGLENDSACGLASEASGPAPGGGAPGGLENDSACPLKPMTEAER